MSTIEALFPVELAMPLSDADTECATKDNCRTTV